MKYKLLISEENHKQLAFDFGFLALVFLILVSASYCSFELLCFINTIIVFFFWENIYNSIYNIWSMKKIQLVKFYLQENKPLSNNSTFIPITHTENYEDSMIKYYKEQKNKKFLINIISFAKHTEKNKDKNENSLLNLTLFNYKFSSVSSIYQFFITTFFLLILIYFISIISVHKFIDTMGYNPEYKLYTEILSLIVLFAVYLFIFVKHMNIDIHQDIEQVNSNIHDIKYDFRIITYPTNPIKDIKYITKQALAIKENFNKIMINILQISTPIFFLSHISIIIYLLNKDNF